MKEEREGGRGAGVVGEPHGRIREGKGVGQLTPAFGEGLQFSTQLVLCVSPLELSKPANVIPSWLAVRPEERRRPTSDFSAVSALVSILLQQITYPRYLFDLSPLGTFTARQRRPVLGHPAVRPEERRGRIANIALRPTPTNHPQTEPSVICSNLPLLWPSTWLKHTCFAFAELVDVQHRGSPRPIAQNAQHAFSSPIPNPQKRVYLTAALPQT